MWPKEGGSIFLWPHFETPSQRHACREDCASLLSGLPCVWATNQTVCAFDTKQLGSFAVSTHVMTCLCYWSFGLLGGAPDFESFLDTGCLFVCWHSLSRQCTLLQAGRKEEVQLQAELLCGKTPLQRKRCSVIYLGTPLFQCFGLDLAYISDRHYSTRNLHLTKQKHSRLDFIPKENHWHSKMRVIEYLWRAELRADKFTKSFDEICIFQADPI